MTAGGDRGAASVVVLGKLLPRSRSSIIVFSRTGRVEKCVVPRFCLVTKSGPSHTQTGPRSHGGRFQPLARLRAAERPSDRRYRHRDPAHLRRCVPGVWRLVRERTHSFFVRLIQCFPAANLTRGPASALTAPLPPPCPIAHPKARTSCLRSRPSPRAQRRTPVPLWLTARASAARCTSRSVIRDSTGGATRRSET